MGKLTEIKSNPVVVDSALPSRLYVVRDVDGEYVHYFGFDDFTIIHDGEVVGVYELADVRTKKETHSLV